MGLTQKLFEEGNGTPKAGLKLCMVVTGFEAMHWMVVRRKKRALNTEGPFPVRYARAELGFDWRVFWEV